MFSAIAFATLPTPHINEPSTACAHRIAYDERYVRDWKGLFRPFRARG